jgi:imidazolonepropionase-like amidohydrolase
MTGTVYRAARVFTATSDEHIEDGAVSIDGGRLSNVGPFGGAPCDKEVVDLGDVTVLPGLIDTHVHLVWDGSVAPHEIVEKETCGLTVLRAAAHAEAHLRAGVTTVRDLGSTDAIAVEVGRAVEAGIVVGPRVLAAGRAIAMTGGHVWYLGREADGADVVRRAARSELKGGAGCIKLMASGGAFGRGEEVGSPQLTVEEMRAAVEEAHKVGVKVAAHAHSLVAIENALAAGVDSIEHASFLEDETAHLAREQGCSFVPTMSAIAVAYERGAELGMPDYMRRKIAELSAVNRQAFRIALGAGCSIAAGSDGGLPGQLHGAVADELLAFVEAGASAPRAIRCGTSEAASALGLEDVGTLEVGKRADLLAVSGDPLKDIRSLREVCGVWSEGSRIR